MAANVETMFYTRTKPWHGLGTMVEEAPTSGAALELAGLDWRVVQKNLVTEEGITVPGFRANLRETDNQVLGVVSDRYKVVQNEEAFAFTNTGFNPPAFALTTPFAASNDASKIVTVSLTVTVYVRSSPLAAVTVKEYGSV